MIHVNINVNSSTWQFIIKVSFTLSINISTLSKRNMHSKKRNLHAANYSYDHFWGPSFLTVMQCSPVVTQHAQYLVLLHSQYRVNQLWSPYMPSNLAALSAESSIWSMEPTSTPSRLWRMSALLSLASDSMVTVMLALGGGAIEVEVTVMNCGRLSCIKQQIYTSVH